jgi:hypothetical protein
VLLLPFFYWILLRARSLCFMSRADITRAPSLLLPVSFSFLDIFFLHYTTCVSESWRNMQSVDAYTMFMAWTLAPHMVDTRSQTALFKSAIPVPGTPNEPLVNRNVMLWDDARYFQKPLDQAYHGDCSHATASSGTVASVSKLHQSDMGHPRISSGCFVSQKNGEDRRISMSGLKEASS